MQAAAHEIDDEGDHGAEPVRRPAYAARPPPLVQPLQLTSFSGTTSKRHRALDLAHEWVALFQTIGGGPNECSAASRGKTSMRMNVPDTIFLSPTGQPSVWYRTSSSKHVKARHFAHVTARSILESLRQKRSQHHQQCAILYTGFETQLLDVEQLENFAVQMENACIRSPARDRLVYDDGDSDDDVLIEDDASGETGIASDGTSAGDEAAAFCVQLYVQRAHGVSFLCLWRQHIVNISRRADRPDSKPDVTGTRVKAIDDVFVVRRNADLEERVRGQTVPRETTQGKSKIMLEPLALDGCDDSCTRKVLEDIGFDADGVVPLLLHMKLLTSEIVSRVNRACGSSRQVQSLACEFFLSPDVAALTHMGVTYKVFFSALAGIQWQGGAASWETFAEVDQMSQSIFEFVASNPRGQPRSSSQRTRSDALADSTTSRPRGMESNFALSLFDELNPRFPSVQMLSVAEKQWKNKTPLLPPHVSPRYIDSEIPKMYRDGQFQPILTPRQCHSVNRLHATASGFARTDAPRHPLSKKHARVEQQLWLRQDEERLARGLAPRSPIKMTSLKPPMRTFTTPRSPRHRHSLIKEELV